MQLQGAIPCTITVAMFVLALAIFPIAIVLFGHARHDARPIMLSIYCNNIWKKILKNVSIFFCIVFQVYHRMKPKLYLLQYTKIVQIYSDFKINLCLTPENPHNKT